MRHAFNSELDFFNFSSALIRRYRDPHSLHPRLMLLLILFLRELMVLALIFSNFCAALLFGWVDVGCWMLDVGCWMLDVGCWMCVTVGQCLLSSALPTAQICRDGNSMHPTVVARTGPNHGRKSPRRPRYRALPDAWPVTLIGMLCACARCLHRHLQLYGVPGGS